MKLAPALVALALAVPLAGCGGLFVTRAPPVLTYTPADPTDAPLAPRVDGVLVVARPDAGPGLDSDGIAVALPGHRLDVLSGARWSAPVPELVQAYLVRALSARGGFRAVVSDRSAFTGEFLLQTEVRAFTAEYAARGEPPRIRVWLHGELGRAHERSLLASVEATGEAQATEDRQAAVIAAFEVALAAAAHDLGAQAHAAALAAPAPRG